MPLQLSLPNQIGSVKGLVLDSSLTLRHSFNCRHPLSRRPIISAHFQQCPDIALGNGNGNGNGKPRGGDTKGNFMKLEMKVREYEVDRYGVVNNAIYSSYCEHACLELLKSLGVNAIAVANENVLAFSHLTLKFLAPLRSEDRFVLKIRVVDTSATRIYFQVVIHESTKVETILEANCTGVWLDKSYRPTRLPPQVKSKLTQSIL